MSPTDHLRGLMAPEKSRWQPMLMGLALAIAGIEAVMLFKPPELIWAILMILVLAAWFVGACAMVGFVRWYFASERSQARRDRADAVERENK
ncbi:MAG: hypothetical protein ACREUP_11360 [Burkholderiales bacterium]